MAWSEYSGKMRALVVCREECPWQTKALMMENLYLKKREWMHMWNINIICYYCGTLSCECILAEKGMLRGATLWHWNIQCGDPVPSKQQGLPEEMRMLMREMFSLVTIPLCQCASIGLWGLSRTYIQLLLLEDIYNKRNFLASVLGWYYLYTVSLS